MAATDEKNLSTSQPPAQTYAWVPGPDGYTGGAQRASTPSRQGAQAACDLDTAEATRVTNARAGRPRLGFGSAGRLHSRAEFRRVQHKGARFQTAHFVVYAARLPESQAVQLGTAISRRLGNAVIRNRLKRRIRECFRSRLRERLPAGTALVVVGRVGASKLETRSIMDELEIAVTQLQLRLKQGHE